MCTGVGSGCAATHPVFALWKANGVIHMRQQKQAEYRGFRTAGIRLTEELMPSLVSHRSDRMQPRLYAIHMFDKAHLVMLTEEGLIPRADGVAMLKTLRQMEADGVEAVRLAVQGGMHSGEQYLIRRLGEAVGGRIHLGRSSGDLGEVSTRIYVRDQLLGIMDKVLALRGILVDLARRHVDTVMPGFTHAQHAQPTTWGHELLSWASVLERDFERLYQTFCRVNRSPAGAAILTGSDFPLNRHRVAELLGFASVERNTFDAILSHDNLFDTMSALSILHMNLARWADDLMLFNTSEFGLIDFPDRFCGTSSIMMQKKNAYAPQEIKGAAAETVGGMVTAFLVEKDPTSVPILDRERTRQAFTRSFESLSRDLGWLIELIPALQVNEELMRERAGAYWGQATDVAGALVREKGLPWRTAHQIVGILVRYTVERHMAPADVTPELLDEAAIEYMDQPVRLSAEALRDALDPAACVHRRTLYGGPAPEEVTRRLPEYEAVLTEDGAKLAAAREGVRRGAAALEEAIQHLVA